MGTVTNNPNSPLCPLATINLSKPHSNLRTVGKPTKNHSRVWVIFCREAGRLELKMVYNV